VTRGRAAIGAGGAGVRVSIGGAAGAVVGSVLTAVAALPPGAVITSRQWTRDGANISGATGATYTLQAGDIGRSIGCVVTATVPASGAIVIGAGSVPIGTLHVNGSPLQINGAYLRIT
jgi:hypothetical protein